MRFWIVCGAIVLASWAGSAAATSTVEVNVKPHALAAACHALGGTYASGDKGYSCSTANCDSKGGSCSVVCLTTGECTVTTPDKLPDKVTVYALLQDGDPVNHGPGVLPNNAPAQPKIKLY
jgi:hypothetical protein